MRRTGLQAGSSHNSLGPPRTFTIHLQEVGKLVGGDGSTAVIIPDECVKNAKPSNSPMLREDDTGDLYLVDTGAAASVYPHSKLLLSQMIAIKPYKSSCQFISTAGGYELKIRGTLELQPKFAGLRHNHEFLVADVKQPILGYPFLRDHKATIRTADAEIIFKCKCSGDEQSQQRAGSTQSSSRPTTAATPQPPARQSNHSSQPRTRQPVQYGTAVPSLRPPQSFNIPVPKQTYANVLQDSIITVNKLVERATKIQQDFSDIQCDGIPPTKPLHGIQHTIKTVGDPVRQPYRRLDAARLKIAKEYFAKMCAEGVCKRANSPWSSPLHMVPKPDGSARPCGDYRLLNSKTVRDTYTLPNLRDFIGKMAGKKIFSTIDLTKGYWQIPMDPESIPKTAVITPFGTYVFLKMSFGLMNAGSTFQRLMDQVLDGLDCIFVYLDDILIASNSIQEHERDVREVLQRLRSAGLYYNPAKSSFFQQEGVHRTNIQQLQSEVHRSPGFI